MLLFFLLLPLFNDKDKYNTTFFLLKVKRLIDAPHRRRAGQRVQRAHTRTREEKQHSLRGGPRGRSVGWVEHRRHCTTGGKKKNAWGAERNSPLAHGKTNGCGGEEEGVEKNKQAAGATETDTAVHGSNPGPK